MEREAIPQIVNLKFYGDGMVAHRKKIQWLVWLLWIPLLSCGYRFVGGGTLPAGVDSVFIPMFENRTTETGLEIVITNAFISEITRNDKNAYTSRRDKAGAILTGVVRNMRVSNISRKGSQTTVQRRVTLVVDAVLTDRDGAVIWSVVGAAEDEEYDVAGDKASTDRNRRAALEALSDVLAENVYGQMTDDF